MAKLPVTYLLTFKRSEVPGAIDSECDELIRCKDCVYYRQYADGRYDCDNLYGIADAYEDGFCSRAERRKDNG